MSENPLDLEGQIKEARRSITADGYPMSIGELTNLYRDGELIIRPEFQRYFRWSPIQKSRLVESLLLGIPIPSIFVAQTDTGTWELVDGLQRVSTLLELQGQLLDVDKQHLPMLPLVATKYLPGLEGKVWDDPNPEVSLTEAQRLDIKRSKIDIKILKRESSTDTKFDLFQRLNSYGSVLTPQEVRSALLVAAAPGFLTWAEGLASYEPFVRCTMLSDRLTEERYDLELVLRFLILHNRPADNITVAALKDFRQLLDDESVEMAKRNPEGLPEMEGVFKYTFSILSEGGGDAVFRRWDPSSKVFKGSFLNTAYEVFGLGLGFHVANGSAYRSDLDNVVKEFWSKDYMQSGFATGRSTEARLTQFIPLGRQLLAQF